MNPRGRVSLAEATVASCLLAASACVDDGKTRSDFAEGDAHAFCWLERRRFATSSIVSRDTIDGCTIASLSPAGPDRATQPKSRGASAVSHRDENRG
jgi:hypothetical protein